MADLIEYLRSPFVLRALLGLLFIAVNASLAGGFAAFRSATFLISGAAHAALAGAAIVLVVGGALAQGDIAPVMGGAVVAVLLALFAAGGTDTQGRRDTDVTIGVGFAFSMALAVLLISLIPESAARVWGILIGDMLLLTRGDLWVLGVTTAAITTCFVLCWRPFLFITFDFEGAQAFGIPARAYNYLLFALIGLSTAVLLKSVGAIVVFAMLAAPAATAKLLARSVRRVMLYAFCITLLSGIIALIISNYLRFSVSALAALIASGSYFLGRAYVWHQSRRISNGHRPA
jgi:ABC-type Mn2+/Zn2+ transport system permease subunit